MIQERGASGKVTKNFLHNGLQAEDKSYVYTRDHLGSVREVVNLEGVVEARYDYSLWGARKKLSGSVDVPFGFTGHYYHEASGLVLAPYRAYAPELGRWISRDPIEEKGGLNLYGYVGNDPVGAIDPDGLDTYLVNRDLAVFGSSARSRYNPFTHTFVVTTNPGGTIRHTYSWGNDTNPTGWTADHPLDLKTAREALNRTLAEKMGNAELDDYVQLVFEDFSDSKNSHLNGIITNNCKSEADKLINKARELLDNNLNQ